MRRHYPVYVRSVEAAPHLSRALTHTAPVSSADTSEGHDQIQSLGPHLPLSAEHHTQTIDLFDVKRFGQAAAETGQRRDLTDDPAELVGQTVQQQRFGDDVVAQA